MFFTHIFVAVVVACRWVSVQAGSTMGQPSNRVVVARQRRQPATQGWPRCWPAGRALLPPVGSGWSCVVCFAVRCGSPNETPRLRVVPRFLRRVSPALWRRPS